MTVKTGFSNKNNIHIPTIKNSSGREFVAYLIYIRYKQKINFEKDMNSITFLDIFWANKKELRLSPELNIEEMF